jgi:hypothetical protein
MKLGLWDLLQVGVPIGASFLGTPALGIAAAGAMGGLGAGVKGGDIEEILKQAGLGAGTAALGSGFGKAIGSIAGKAGAKGAQKAAERTFASTFGAAPSPGISGGIAAAVPPIDFKAAMSAAGNQSATGTARWLERLQTMGNFMDVAEQGKMRWDEITGQRRQAPMPQAPPPFQPFTGLTGYDPERFMRRRRSVY